MKRLVLIALALLLVVPAIGNAGSVTSRFDLEIGGYVKFDVGYANQNVQEATTVAPRDSYGSKANLYDEHSSGFMSAADTALSFLVKGPDAGGAKTSAQIIGNFRGTNSGNVFGGFQLVIASIKLNWANSELIMGKHFQQFGTPYAMGNIGIADFGTLLTGGALPMQVAYRINFTKNFNIMIGAVQPTEWQGSGSPLPRQYNDGYSRSGWPAFAQSEVEFKTDSCGKIGPNMLRFALGGLLGQETKTNTLSATSSKLVDDKVPVWLAAFRTFIPIIPEKQGNKANALFFSGTSFIGQNPSGTNWLGVPNGPTNVNPSNGSYWRPISPATGVANDAAAPTYFGGFTQLSYYITNKTWVNAMYGYMKYNYSYYARNQLPQTLLANESDSKGPNVLNATQTYGFNVFYDATPNLRYALGWYRLFSVYNGYGTPTNGTSAFSTGTGNLSPSGQYDMVRLGVWYFF